MQVEAIQSKIIDVELSDSTVKGIVIDNFCMVCNIKNDYYLKGENIVYDNFVSGKAFVVVVRKASEEDKYAVNFLLKLTQEL